MNGTNAAGGSIFKMGDTIFFDDGTLYLIDQTLLPTLTIYLELTTPGEVVEAIKRLAVRGAMAIGVAGAYGVLLGALGARGGGAGAVAAAAGRAVKEIGDSRPTARNLFWALERMERAVESSGTRDEDVLLAALRQAAEKVALDTMETNRKLVDAGQSVVGEGGCFLTHCNTGPLAALRYGTALGVLIEAHRRGKTVHVYVDETRPLLQGSRLTAWELAGAGVPYTILPDGAAGSLMSLGRVDAVITGADRIAANGDTANKVGTYGLAVLARSHGIRFYVAAPGSTVDLACPDGGSIVIEERGPEEVRCCGGALSAPSSAPVYNPAFDVTPADCITGMVTEEGVLEPPYDKTLRVFEAAPGSRGGSL